MSDSKYSTIKLLMLGILDDCRVVTSQMTGKSGLQRFYNVVDPMENLNASCRVITTASHHEGHALDFSAFSAMGGYHHAVCGVGTAEDVAGSLVFSDVGKSWKCHCRLGLSLATSVLTQLMSFRRISRWLQDLSVYYATSAILISGHG